MEMNSTGITYGYIRVSTTFQNDDRHWLAMDVVFLLVKIFCFRQESEKF